MSTNFAIFEPEMRAWAERQLPQDFVKFHRLVGLKLVELVVPRTPVKTGLHRGSWTIGIDQLGSGEGPLDPQGSSTIARCAADIEAAPPFSVINFTNSGPAIDLLEHGDPTRNKGPISPQAPRGMVGISIEELRTIFGE